MKRLLTLFALLIFFFSSSSSVAQWSEVQKFWPPNIESTDLAGLALDFDGNHAVVGSPNNIFGTGKADIFERNADTGEWNHLLTLSPPSLSFGSSFGFTVAIDGDVAIVGAPLSDEAGSLSGEVYVFHQDYGGANNWGFVKKLVPLMMNNITYQNRFGWSVDVSGDNIAVGSLTYDLPLDQSSFNAGRVYVFNRDQGGADNWGQVQVMEEIDFPFEGDEDKLGSRVAIDGNILVAASEDDEIANQSGAVYVYEKDNGGANNWGLVTKLKASDAAQNDFFGTTGLDVQGDIIVAGSFWDDDLGSNSGSAYIFIKDQGGVNNWGEVAKIIAPDGDGQDHFGQTVAVYEDKVLVGAPQHDMNSQFWGAAYLFEQNLGGPDNWGFVQKLHPSDYPPYGHRFGTSLQMQVDQILVGAPEDYEAFPEQTSDDAGAVYAFVPTIAGCSISTACNYDPSATENDGSCYFVGDSCDDEDSNTINDVYQANCECIGEAIVEGCIDNTACNFDSTANLGDGSCYYIGDSCDDQDEWTENDAYNVDCECEGNEIPQIPGCMDFEACNFDSTANVDDGSCEYLELYAIIGSTTADILTESSYNYNATVGSTYEWTVEGGAVVEGQGTNSITAIWSNPGTYDVTVLETNEDGCEGELVSMNVVVDPVGIIEGESSGVVVYPNPARDFVMVEVGAVMIGSRYGVIDGAGKLVSEGALTKTTTTLNTAELASGNYVISISKDQGVVRQQILIER